METAPCSFISLTDVELAALIKCALHRLAVIVPGLSLPVARVLADKWRELGPESVQVVLDPDPEVCRLGLGEYDALELLRQTATGMKVQVLQQQGLRVGLVVTDETITVFAPVPLLIEAGGRPGERRNAVRLDARASAEQEQNQNIDLCGLNLKTSTLDEDDVKKTCEELQENPPVSFDVSRKVRVFNSRIEFVEFEVRGAALTKKTVPIPTDLLGLAKEPEAQKLLRSSFRLLGDSPDLSGEHIHERRQGIAKKYLIMLPKHGTVILRSNKADFEASVEELRSEVLEFQKLLRERAQRALDENREKLVRALRAGVLANPPDRWIRLLGSRPRPEDVEHILRRELTKAFGSAKDLIDDMKVNVVFKGVTYESLNDPDFTSALEKTIPFVLGPLHEEFDAAAARTIGSRNSIT